MEHNEHDDSKVRERAYHLWEQEGRPEGRHEDHWRQASGEAAGGTGQGQSGSDQGGDSVPNPIGVPADETLPPGSQATGIDGPVGGAVSEQQAGSGQGGGASSVGGGGRNGAKGASAR
jgi:hypothetical protein